MPEAPESLARREWPSFALLQVAAVLKWLKSLPLAKRPLVKSSVQLLAEEGIKALQVRLQCWHPSG